MALIFFDTNCYSSINPFWDFLEIDKFFYLPQSKIDIQDNDLKCNYYILKCKNCTLEEQAIIKILKVNPRVTQEEIAIQIGKSVRTVKTYMAEMQEKGLIERKNGKKNGEWILNY